MPNNASSQAPDIITIDGPSGVGKTTVAQLVSDRTDLPLLASGRLYRALAWVLQQESISDDATVSERTPGIDFGFTSDSGITYRGTDITEHLYDEEVSLKASQIATNPVVRKRLVELQRQFSKERGCIAEGRSTGIEVFPEAPLKIWLTADYAVRFDRIEKSRGTEIAEQTLARDKMDAERQHGPMMKAPDGVEIDSTLLDAESIANQIVSLYQNNKSAKTV